MQRRAMLLDESISMAACSSGPVISGRSLAVDALSENDAVKLD
jgi:hypothetical protein